MSLHSTLTGTDLHEPKGVAAAAANLVYMSNGSGSGSWLSPATNIKNANLETLSGQFANISSSASSIYLPTPLAGKVVAIYIVLQNAITVASCNITVKINGVAVTGSGITITVGASGAGVVFSSAPSGSNTLTTGQAIEIHSDGGSTTSCVAFVTALVNVS